MPMIYFVVHVTLMVIMLKVSTVSRHVQAFEAAIRVSGYVLNAKE